MWGAMIQPFFGRDENVSKMDVDCRPGRRPVGKAQSGRRRRVGKAQDGRRRPVRKAQDGDGRRLTLSTSG